VYRVPMPSESRNSCIVVYVAAIIILSFDKAYRARAS